MLFPIDTIAALLYLMSITVESGTEIPSLPEATGMFFMCLACAYLTSEITVRFTLYRLRHNGSSSGTNKRTLMWGADFTLRMLAVALYIILIDQSLWHVSAAQAIGLAENMLVLSLLGILPYILICAATWAALYRLNNFDSPGKWRMSSYILHRARYGFFMLGLWIPMLALSEWFSSITQTAGDFGGMIPFKLISYMLLLACGWVFPRFLRMFWGCTPMPEGELRSRIMRLQEKTGVRFSEICVWNLGGGRLLNAAAVGFFPPFRYLFISRAMANTLQADELDAVICHEMGHVKHHHIIYYIIMTVGAMELCMSLMTIFPINAEESVFAFVIMLALYTRLVFGYFSRRFERQADLFALETMGEAAPFCNAMERIGVLSGNIRSAPSWHHMSIAERVAFIQTAERNPSLITSHHSEVNRVLRIGLSVGIAGILWGLFTPEYEYTTESGTQIKALRDDYSAQVAHWKRAKYFMPDEAEPDLRLAELIGKKSESEAEVMLAMKYAIDGQKKAKTREQRLNASLLLERLENLKAKLKK